MIKLIIWDVDGTLIETKNLHFECLNLALDEIDSKYVISHEDHIARFDGKPTMVKLAMLTRERGLPVEHHEQIKRRKQEFTVSALKVAVKSSNKFHAIFAAMRELGYKQVVASNASRQTIRIIIAALGVAKYVDMVISNEDVNEPKPAPDMYLKAMLTYGASPHQTLIVEDAPVGRQAVQEVGAHLYGVNSPEDVSLATLLDQLARGNRNAPRRKWKDDNLNVLIPMAGAGKRFADAGYTFPKFLIDIRGKPMIQMVIDCLAIDAHYIFVVQKEHMEQYSVRCMMNMIAKDNEIVVIDGMTEGAACTTLAAKKLINNNKQLIVANCDQYIEWDSTDFMYAMQSPGIDGALLTFPNNHVKWSYAAVDENGWVTEVAEKRPISPHASVGLYYYKYGSDYVKYAEQMIAKNVRVNGELYVCPVLNEAIADGKKFRIWPVERMQGTGTPEDLNEFLRNCPL